MKNNRITIIGASLCVVLAMFVGCGGRSGEKEYSKAMKEWEKGNLVQARTLFEKSTGRLTGDEKKSQAFNNLGLVLWQLGEPKDASIAFGEACNLSKTITDSTLNQAIAQFHTGDFDGARMSLSMYLGEHPKNKTALALKGLIAAKNRDWAQSTRLISDALGSDPNDPAARNAFAVAELNHSQNSAQAIARLKKLIAASPNYAPALYNLAVVYDLWQHDKPNATSYYRDYLQKAGKDGSHASAALTAIKRLSGSAPNATSASAAQYMTAGAKLHSAGKYAAAVTQFQKAIQVNPTQKNAYYNMGLAYYQMKNYPAVAEACKQALGIDPGFANARYMLVLAYVQQKRWNDAEREAKALSKIDAKRGTDMLQYISKARAH